MLSIFSSLSIGKWVSIFSKNVNLFFKWKDRFLIWDTTNNSPTIKTRGNKGFGMSKGEDVYYSAANVCPQTACILQLSLTLNIFTVTLSWTRTSLLHILLKLKNKKKHHPALPDSSKIFEHISTWQYILASRVGTAKRTEWLSWQTRTNGFKDPPSTFPPKSFVCTVAFDVVPNIQGFFLLKAAAEFTKWKTVISCVFKGSVSFIFITNTTGLLCKFTL